MPTDLNILKKAFQNVTASYEAAKPGDEPLTRHETVYPDQTIPTHIPQGVVGGWVASGGFPYTTVEHTAAGVQFQNAGATPPSRRYFETNPGRPGYNDVDFVPYNYGTNRFGCKGGALLGHPISWEVVGPTGKSPYTHWQWAVVGATNSIDLEVGVLTAGFTGGPIPTVNDAYGLTGLPNGGLYVLVTLTGSETDFPTYRMLNAPADPLVPVTASEETYRFELFRVASIVNQKITLEASKPLSDYFTIPAVAPKIKMVTLVRPKVTRLAAFPLSTDGVSQSNQVYVFLPPERAAMSEYMPPYKGGGICPDWKTNGTFDAAGALPVGSAGDYGTPSRLPVPQPVQTVTTASISVAAPGVANRWQVAVGVIVSDITAGQVIKVRAVKRDTVTDAQIVQCLGWFEVVTGIAAPGAGTIVLNRVPEVDCVTGDVFYGNGPVGAVTDELELEVYDNVTTIFTDPVMNVGKVSVTRLTNLINPRMNRGSYQGLFDDLPTHGVNPPGPAIFDTTATSLNPGNLTNLGFRVVLFPAKDVGGGVIGPDFDNPITGTRVMLDQTLAPAIEQTLEIDYSAGVLYLSHPPKAGAGCTVAPNGIIVDAVNNPRNEIVLYAACVPFSKEESQAGSGMRVQVARMGGEFGPHDMTDVYGQRLILTPDVASYGLVGNTIVIGSPTADDPSMTGWFQLGQVDAAGTFTSMSAPSFYAWYDQATFTFSGVAPGDPAYVIDADTRLMVLKSPPFPKTTYDFDSVRGASLRNQVLAFQGVGIQVDPTGCITISPVATLDDAYRSNDTTPGLGRVITVDGGAVEARPNDTAGNDLLNASFRVNTTTTTTTDPKNEVGFDFQGYTATGTVDSFAGFIDRRVFTYVGAGKESKFPDNFGCAILGNTVTMPGAGNYFWTTHAASKRSLLIPYFDLLEVNGATYVISGFGATDQEITVCNLDILTNPVWGADNTTATIYRPRFFTSRGNSGTALLNVNSWFMGQQVGYNALLEPFGALNLLAGSATAIGNGDGGGATASLAFWSRVAAAAGAASELILSTAFFDTKGSYVSVLNPDYMQGGALPDYVYRGDFSTRRVLSTYVGGVYSPTALTQPTIGHIVEDYTYLTARYDYLSLLPLVPPAVTPVFAATAEDIATGRILDTTGINFSLVAYGATVVELLTRDPAPYGAPVAITGLFLVRAGDSATSKLWLSSLNGTHGTPTLTNTDHITYRLHLYAGPGRWVNAEYRHSLGAAIAYHSPYHMIPVGIEDNAVGLVFDGTNRTTIVAATPDRHAYRVTAAQKTTVTGTAAIPSNTDMASLDMEGYYKGQDYLYNTSQTIAHQINPLLWLPFTSSQQWNWVDATATWDSTGASKTIKIPIVLPRSSSRLDSAGVRTHRTCLVSITITGLFNNGAGGVPHASLLEIHRVTINAAAVPTIAKLYMGPAAAPQTYNLNGTPGAWATQTITVWEDAGATLPVYIDDTSTMNYYALVESAEDTGVADKISSFVLNYTDPGPRNF